MSLTRPHSVPRSGTCSWRSSAQCKLIKFRSPIITNTDLGKIKNLDQAAVLTWDYPDVAVTDGRALEKAIAEMCRKAEESVDRGHNFIILSDRGISQTMVPIPLLWPCRPSIITLSTQRKGCRWV